MAETPILAYILLGQSNMYGTSATVDPNDPDLVMLDPRCLNRTISTGGVTWPPTTAYSAFRQAPALLHGYLYTTPPGGAPLSGPATHFGIRMRALYPHLRFALLATARPSELETLLTNTNNDYSDTIDTAYHAQMLGATIAGILTHHGERDAGFTTTPGGYANPTQLHKAQTHHERYEQVIAKFRGDLGLPNLPNVYAHLGLVNYVRIPGIPLVSEDPFRTLWEEVQDSQLLINVSNSVMVETHDFWDIGPVYPDYVAYPGQGWPATPDGLHNTSAGNVTEGQRFADAIVALGHPLLTPSPRLWFRA